MSMLRRNDYLAGRFRIDDRIAEGGMATVYRGFDQTLDQMIAIKVLRRGAIDDVARFEREAQILEALAHPAISRYIADGATDDGARYLVTAWIDGPTLAEHHAGAGLTPADAVAVVARVADALGAAHARGLVHRDVKPDNILLPGGELARATLIDFGLGRRAAGDARLTETGTVVGTPGYMAPEQARGERAIDARSDVFALGCVLYECATGQLAFAGRNPAAVMARIVLCEPPPIRQVWPEVPAALERLVGRMLAKRREDRPRDAAEIAAALSAIAAPDGPRRRRTTGGEAATAVDDARAAHVIFLQVGPPGTGAVDAEALARAVAPFGASAHALADGAAVAVVPGGDAAAAADCALALARAFGDAPVVLAGGRELPVSVPLAALIDDGAAALERADLERIFGGTPPPPGAIRVDPVTARRLAAAFEIQDDGDGAVWLTRRRAP